MEVDALDVVAHVFGRRFEDVPLVPLHRREPPFCVLIADGDESERTRLTSALERDSRFSRCTEASDAPRAIALALKRQPHLCLLDVGLAGGGIDATREITARLPDTKVLVRTPAYDEQELLAALEAGASGSLADDTDLSRLPELICRVMDGEVAIPRALVGRVVQGLRANRLRRQVVLSSDGTAFTSREWEVLDLLCEGRTTAEIAQRLTVTPATVRSHVSAILGKLGVADRAAAVELVGRR